MTDDIITIKEVAEYIKIREKTACRLVAEGKILGFKIGGSWRFEKSDIQAWIKKLKRLHR